MTSILDLRKHQLRQWLAALAASSAILGISPFHVDSIGGAAIQAGLVTIGAIIGAIIADIFGRRVTLLVSSICAIPVIVLDLSTGGVAQVTSYFYFVGEGIVHVVIPLYVSEIGGTNNSANLMVLSLSIQYLGLVVISTVYAIVPFYNNTLHVGGRFAISALVVAGILFRTTIWWLYPETPHYLNWKKKYQETTDSLAFFRGIKPLRSIQESVNNKSLWQEYRERMMEMVKSEYWKNLGIILSLITIKWVNGAIKASNYLQLRPIYQPTSPQFVPVIVFLLSLIVSVFLILIVLVVGRKYFLVWMINVVSHAYLIDGMLNIAKYWWGVFTILCIQQVGHLIFVGVTLAYAGEFFTVNVRSIAIGMMIIWDRLMSIIFCSIDWAIYGDGIFHHESAYLKSYASYAWIVFMALQFSLWFIIIFFPRFNTVPRSEIEIENSTDIECVQLEATSEF